MASQTEVKRLARQHTESAVRRLAEIAGSENERAAVSACNALLDRAWGKPAQEIDASLSGSIKVIIEDDFGKPKTSGK